MASLGAFLTVESARKHAMDVDGPLHRFLGSRQLQMTPSQTISSGLRVVRSPQPF